MVFDNFSEYGKGDNRTNSIFPQRTELLGSWIMYITNIFKLQLLNCYVKGIVK